MSSIVERARAAARPADLTPRAWLDAGQALLKSGGLKALKLRPLAEALGVSTGSFYHHFADFPAYQGALADYFAGEQVADVIAAIRAAEREPRRRIERLAETVRRDRLSRLALAMRAWGESDARAREAVARHDAVILGFLTESLEALGFARREAQVRAFAIVATGLGTIHAPQIKDDRLSADLLAILLSPVAR